MEEKLLEKVVRSELEIPHAMLEMQKNAEAGIRENVMGKWESLKNWFLDSEKREIQERRYPAALKDYHGNLILAGISYDKKTKRHSCLIEKLNL